MKNLAPWLALLVLPLGFSVSMGLAGSAALHGPAPVALQRPGPVAGALRCVKDRIIVEGVTDERAILFVQDGFSCKPA